MADAARQAVDRHMAAINSKDRARFAATIAFPFLHVEPDGQQVRYPGPDAVPDMTAIPFARAEIVRCEVVAATGALTVFSLRFQRYDESGAPTEQADALWGAHTTDDGWKVGWRQYLGVVGAGAQASLLAPLGGGE